MTGLFNRGRGRPMSVAVVRAIVPAVSCTFVHLSAGSAAAAAGLPVIGGPGHDAGYVGFELPFQQYTPGRPINQRGTAIATAWKMTGVDVYHGLRGLRLDRSGTSTELGTLGLDPEDDATTVYTYAINNAGHAVGTANRYDNGEWLGRRAVRWNAADGAALELTGLGVDEEGVGFAEAYDINDAGVVTGFSEVYDGVTHAYLASAAVRWDAGSTTPTRLNGFHGNGSDSGIAINAAGTVVGYAQRFGTNGADLGYRPVRWDPGSTTPVELGNFGVNPTGQTYAAVQQINDAGVSMGELERWDGSVSRGVRAARWLADGTAQELLPVRGTSSGLDEYTVASAIGSSGAVAGTAAFYAAGDKMLGMRPVVWKLGTNVPTQLAGLGAVADGSWDGEATGVNAAGFAAGWVNQFAADGTELDENAGVIWRPDGSVVRLNALLEAGSPWDLVHASAITDTGWVTGYGIYSAAGVPVQQRFFTLLIPEAGTYGRGDATFDSRVNFDDLLLLAQNYGRPNATLDVDVADFDLDGVTDFDDLLTLAQHYGTAAGGASQAGWSDLDPAFAADWALAQSLVPEPAVGLTILAVASASVGTRARRSAALSRS